MPHTPRSTPRLIKAAPAIGRWMAATITLIYCQYGQAYASTCANAPTSQNVNKLTGLLQSIASLMSGTWFKMIVIVGMAIVIGLLIFDGANLGQGIKNLLSVIAIVLVFFFIISLIMNASPSAALC